MLTLISSSLELNSDTMTFFPSEMRVMEMCRRPLARVCALSGRQRCSVTSSHRKISTVGLRRPRGCCLENRANSKSWSRMRPIRRGGFNYKSWFWLIIWLFSPKTLCKYPRIAHTKYNMFHISRKNEALHSKYHKHISKVNSCLTLQTHLQ